MLDISVLYCGIETASKPHRYGRKLESLVVPPHQSHAVASSAAERRPIVVWNVTRTCNLRCVHCYSSSEAKKYDGELTTEEGKALLDDLADYRVPAVLFSGGEPLVRRDLFDLAAHARAKGLRVVLSTNGTLITPEVARRLKGLEFSYVGISLDGMEQTNDFFRGVEGAYDAALRGFRACTAVGQKVGLRLTLTRHNAQDLDGIFDFIEREGIQRACFYHLVPSGRGHGAVDLAPAESRRAMDTILDRTASLAQGGRRVEILTVDNHCDGPYLYLRMLREGNPRAREVEDLLRWNGGGMHSSGVGIACVDFVGNVHPDQFWMHYTVGNVKETPFSRLWGDATDPLLSRLRDRKANLKGRCASCRFIDLCGGAMRVRAEIASGDAFAPDPACYLTDGEIAPAAAPARS